MKRLMQVGVVVAFLEIGMPRNARSQDILDFKVMYYEESDDRIQVFSPSFLYQAPLSSSLTVTIDGVYDAISGASPTGTPGLNSYQELADVQGLLNAVSGATPSASSSSDTSSAGAPSSGGTSSSDSGTVSQDSTAAGDGGVPVGELKDTRYAGNIALLSRRGEHDTTGKFSLSTEDDYDSIGLSLTDALSFNRRNTVLSYGGAYSHDIIKLLSGSEKSKNVGELLLGVSRVLDAKTSGRAIVTLGHQSGFLSDQYKSVELNGEAFAENRPGSKTDASLVLALLRYVEAARAGVDASYRYYFDDFGINSHMLELAWNQEVGTRWVVSPLLRFYTQNEADFYAVRFSGAPEHYSSDYRLSDMETITVGIKVRWQAGESVTYDLAIERYEQRGTDGETDQSAYPEALVLTSGVRLWF